MRQAGRFEPDAGATADHDDGLPKEFRSALDGRGVVTVLMIPPISNLKLLSP
jgi:hypothetical protein